MQRIVYILACVLAWTTVVAQEEGGRRFVKITHSSDQTVAVDSTGKEWYYDSETGEFVPGAEYRRSSGGGGLEDENDYGDDEVLLPPEVRCTDVHVGNIVEPFNRVVVGLDQRIEGSVACGREVIVRGLVTGNVFSYRTVTVESTGEVRGDVVAREIIRERGGRILGDRKEIPTPGPMGFEIPPVAGPMPAMAIIILAAIAAFICLIMIALVPDNLVRIVNKIESGAVKSFFWGILGWFLIPPVFVLLLITIVGIPVAILIFPFVLLGAFALGFVSVSIWIGRLLAPIFKWQEKSLYVKGMLGILAVAAVLIVANFFHAVGAWGFAEFLTAVFFIVVIISLTIGFGAVLTSKFGMKPKRREVAPGAGPASPIPRPEPPTPPVPPPSRLREPSSSRPVPPPPVPPPPPKPGHATDDGRSPSNI